MVLLMIGFFLVRAIFLAYFLRAAIALFNQLFVRRAMTADESSSILAWDNRTGLVEEITFEDAFLFVMLVSLSLGAAGGMTANMFHKQLAPIIHGGDAYHQSIYLSVSGIMEYVVMSLVFKYFIKTTFARAFVIIFFQTLLGMLIAGGIVVLFSYALA